MVAQNFPLLAALPVTRSTVPHFQEPGRVDPVGPEERMPEAAYAAALDYLVIACVDIVFKHGNRILLAKRNRYPNPSWWIIGGRMAAGEDPQATAQRKAAEEANLPDLAIDRFGYVGTYSTCFRLRSQPPQHHGSHTINITYQIELTDAEQEQLSLLSSEYDSWSWVEVDEIASLLDPDELLEQVLLTVIHDASRDAGYAAARDAGPPMNGR